MPIIVGHRANSGRIILWYQRMGVEYVEVDVNYVDGRILVKHGRPQQARATPVGALFAWIDYKLFYRDPLLKTQPLHRWLRLVSGKLPLRGVVIDLKNNVPPEELARELERAGVDLELYVSTNDHRIIPSVRRALPQARILASFNVAPADIVSCVRGLPVDGVGVRIDFLDQDIAGRIRGAGLLLSTWTVNTREQALRALRHRADIIITDRPDRVKKVMEELAEANG